tara:strand:- start:1348 stop:1797 length:450 start_codon:yes stop_codon:yes gene_type:complete
MSGINKVIIVGNLGAQPDCKTTTQGTTVANLSVATTEKWFDKNEQINKEKTEWHRVCVFGKPADYIADYAKKGSKVYVEGKLQTRKWQDKTGKDQYTTEVVVSGYKAQIQLLDKKEQDDNQAENRFSYDSTKMQKTAVTTAEEEDDIPF